MTACHVGSIMCIRSSVYGEIKNTASEFNARGDLFAGANIAGFLRVANVMMMHGAV